MSEVLERARAAYRRIRAEANGHQKRPEIDVPINDRNDQSTPQPEFVDNQEYDINDRNDQSTPQPEFVDNQEYDINDRNDQSTGSSAAPSGDGWQVVQDARGLQTVLQALDETDFVGVDTETTGLERTDRTRLLQLATVRGTFIVDIFSVDPVPLWPALAEKQLVVHNAAFDLVMLAALGFEPGTVHDTMILSQLLHGSRKGKGFHGLERVVERELGRTLDKTAGLCDWSGSLTLEQLAYAATDAEVLLPLFKDLTAKIAAVNLQRAADMERRCLPAMLWLGRSGAPFDRTTWEALAIEAKKEAQELGDQLDAAAPARDGFLEKRGAWNWGSADQVTEVFRLLDIKLDGTDDDKLAGLEHPLAELLRKYRSASKRSQTYGLKWLQHVSADGRVYARWRQLGADSGRMACSNPNLQNLPRDLRYRRCFRAPAGRVLVKADYSQIELRIAAKIANEKEMLAAYSANQDLHALTARRILGKDEVAKTDRQLAKAVNFGLLFGMAAKGFRIYARSSYGVNLTLEEAERYRHAFFTAYPGLAKWHRHVKRTRPNDLRTLGGRRRLLANKAPDTERLNTPVQGTGADGLKLALALLWERRQECPGAFPVLVVHDEIVVEADAAQADATAEWLKKAMLDGIAPLIAPVPVEVDASVSRTWGGD